MTAHNGHDDPARGLPPTTPPGPPPGTPSGTGSTPPPAADITPVDITAPAADITAADITELRSEIDHLDAEILRLVHRRTEVSRRIGALRRAAGGPRIVLSREQAVLARFRDLGPEGRELGMMLLRLGRGLPGRRRSDS